MNTRKGEKIAEAEGCGWRSRAT